ncbi:phasin family protein [Candidatus Paraburkholderia kirkii UZHbot1]|uniref:Phasin family protein n=1 Tax=Candidatus Paraburkholderia kirkii UZHbot1 TaxID=1055526 RepID=G4M8G3_9BURK|nr:phasin family protein [Candidatus Paraburkholderia kirkii UZHbot1]
MSSLAPENIIASQKASVDTIFGLAAQAVQGFEKLVDLNVRTLRTTLDEQQALFARASSVRDSQEFFALQNQHLQDLAQRTQAYWINVYEIAAGVRGGYLEAAQDQFGKSQRNVSGEEGRAAGCRGRAERRERREPGGRPCARQRRKRPARRSNSARRLWEGRRIRPPFSFSDSAAQLLQREFVGPADPHRRVAMIAQRVAGVRVHEDIERAVIQRQPFEHRREQFPTEAELERPHRMRSHRPFVKAAQAQRAALHFAFEPSLDDEPQLARRVAALGIEIDMGMPVGDRARILSFHRLIYPDAAISIRVSF